VSSFGDFEDTEAEEASDEGSVGGEMAAVPVNARSEGSESRLAESFSTLCHSSLSRKGYLLHRMYDIVDLPSFFCELAAIADCHHARDWGLVRPGAT
jgi:hypothetical protein